MLKTLKNMFRTVNSERQKDSEQYKKMDLDGPGLKEESSPSDKMKKRTKDIDLADDSDHWLAPYKRPADLERTKKNSKDKDINLSSTSGDWKPATTTSGRRNVFQDSEPTPAQKDRMNRNSKEKDIDLSSKKKKAVGGF